LECKYDVRNKGVLLASEQLVNRGVLTLFTVYCFTVYNFTSVWDQRIH
jgi:hypothetical protein